jgi:hypothetical protein
MRAPDMPKGWPMEMAPPFHVEPVVGDAERVAAVEDLAGEGFVDLPQAHVAHRKAEAVEQLGDGEDGADAHLVGGLQPATLMPR